MSKLIPISDIPCSARKLESRARKAAGSRSTALEVAQYEIVVAPGCHGRPNDDPPRVGWVLTRDAAEALASRQTHMPDGTSHSRLRYQLHSE